MLHHNLAEALDPVLFAKESLGFEADEKQAQVLRSGSKRLALNCSRQWGKSTIAALRSLHRAVFYPRSVILIVSFIKDQSAELYRKIETFQSIMENRAPDLEHSKQSMTFMNKSRILILSGREQTVRGYSPDLVILDEAARIPDETYFSIRPSISVSNGALMIISTPRGRRGFFHQEFISGREWERYEITGWECPRISDEFLKSEREKIGPSWFAQEYECSFITAEGQLFNLGDIMASFSQDVSPFAQPAITSEVEAFSARY